MNRLLRPGERRSQYSLPSNQETAPHIVTLHHDDPNPYATLAAHKLASLIGFGLMLVLVGLYGYSHSQSEKTN
jgi:hypothetical protein